VMALPDSCIRDAALLVAFPNARVMAEV
jgi:hypothetical protein